MIFKRILSISWHILFFLILSNTLCTMQGFNYEHIAPYIVCSKKTAGINSYISFLRDIHGEQYVVKQYKNRKIIKLLGTTINELVALEIGNSIGISLDTACLIPAGVAFPGKDLHAPATLHTFAPGVQCHKFFKEEYEHLFLYQQDDKGLTREVIYHMSRHRDLPPILALDTFVGNNDRGKNNLFYNQDTDSFIGIDLGAAFRRDLCAPSQATITSLLSDENNQLSDQEWQGLTLYNETLTTLVTLFPPEYTCTKLDEYAQRAGFFDATFFTAKEQKKWKRFFGSCKHNIRVSYAYATELVKALEQLLNTYKNH